MRNFLERNAPPGVDVEKEEIALVVGVILSLIVSIDFPARYLSAYRDLFEMTLDGQQVLREGAQMSPFLDCLGFSLAGFMILAFVILSFAINHYRYFRQESKSVYLMRRLPQRWEYQRRIWLLPVLGAVIVAVIALLLGFIFWEIYLHVTPEQTLPENLWRGDWREESWLWY